MPPRSASHSSRTFLPSGGHLHCQGIHTIAQDTSVPSIFLEYPTWDYFEKEIRKGYDFVGISFFATCMDIVLEMCQRIRKLSPQSKIVLGHYGALAFNAYYPEDFKKEHADYVCIGEGVFLSTDTTTTSSGGKLLRLANVTLPEAIPCKDVKVATRKKLPERRKKI